LVFTLESVNGETLYFEGKMTKDTNTIMGFYGVDEDSAE
jgi:hypothetical protein